MNDYIEHIGEYICDICNTIKDCTYHFVYPDVGEFYVCDGCEKEKERLQNLYEK